GAGPDSFRDLVAVPPPQSNTASAPGRLAVLLARCNFWSDFLLRLDRRVTPPRRQGGGLCSGDAPGLPRGGSRSRLPRAPSSPLDAPGLPRGGSRSRLPRAPSSPLDAPGLPRGGSRSRLQG